MSPESLTKSTILLGANTLTVLSQCFRGSSLRASTRCKKLQESVTVMCPELRYRMITQLIVPIVFTRSNPNKNQTRINQVINIQLVYVLHKFKIQE